MKVLIDFFIGSAVFGGFCFIALFIKERRNES